MRELNLLQRRFVLEVLFRLKTNADPFYFYLAGGAGVGKSRVVNAIVQCFLRYCNSSSNDRYPVEALPVVIGAPTGKAAFNVFGNTIHTLFRLPPNQQNGEIGPLEESVAQSLRVRFRHTKLFIIDEISMVGANQLYHIDSRLRQIFKTTQDFGGKSLLVVGDFRQLPPIGMKSVYKCPELAKSEKVRETMVSVNPLWQKFTWFELTEIMRQRDEFSFCKALNNLAQGTMDEDDIALMRARIVAKEVAPKDAIWLFWSNDECEDFNKDYHDSLKTQSELVKAEHIITEHGSEFERMTAMLLAEQLPRKEQNGLPNSVNLQIGAVYFVTINIDVGDGLFNGATGELKAIEKDETGKIVAAWLQFCHPNIGQYERSKPSTQLKQKQKNYDISWTPIRFRAGKLFKTKKLGKLDITRIMIPLQAANGMTICKSQGSSLPKVVVCLKNGMTRQQIYVACSRATTYNGFFIVGNFKPPAPAVDEDTIEIERLRKNPLEFTIRFPEDFQHASSLYYHNVGGFLKNLPDIKSDKNISAHQYLIFVEPKLRKEAEILLSGYKLVCRVDCSNERAVLNSEGVLFFVKDSAKVPDKVDVFNVALTDKNCIILTAQFSDVVVVAAYKSPRYDPVEFMKHIELILARFWFKKPIILLGDMNLDLQLAKTTNFDSLISRGMRFVIPRQASTTNRNSNIDVCLSNHPCCEASVYEIYYTYHKAISVHF